MVVTVLVVSAGETRRRKSSNAPTKFTEDDNIVSKGRNVMSNLGARFKSVGDRARDKATVS
jgi:hypothetical protein